MKEETKDKLNKLSLVVALANAVLVTVKLVMTVRKD